MPITLMILDDHSVVREGLRYLIELNQDFEVTGEAEHLAEALEIMAAQPPDILILDYKLTRGDGILACLAVKRRHPEVKVLLLTAFAEPHVVLEAVKAGAEGFLLKSADHQRLIQALYDLYEGKSVLDPAVTDLVLDRIRTKRRKTETGLTDREQLILDEISKGLTNQEIASTLQVSEKTVRNLISSIFKKIDVTNRTEAATYWLQQQYPDSLHKEDAD